MVSFVEVTKCSVCENWVFIIVNVVGCKKLLM